MDQETPLDPLFRCTLNMFIAQSWGNQRHESLGIPKLETSAVSPMCLWTRIPVYVSVV